MPRQGVGRLPTVVQLTRDAIAAQSGPVASTSKQRIGGGDAEGPAVVWAASSNPRSPGRAVYRKPEKPAPLGTVYQHRLPAQLGLKEAARKVQPEHGTRARYLEHFRQTLASDLLYLTYDHRVARNPPPNPAREPRDPLDPYNLGVVSDRGKWEPLIPKERLVTPDTAVELKAINLSFTYFPAYTNKTKLLPIMGALRAITGIQPEMPGELQQTVALRMLYTTQEDKRRGMRVGVPIGVKVRLVGQSMQHFLETLVELVLPRWRNFQGVALPASWGEKQDASGTFDWTLPAEAVPLFPQLEINADRYPHFADLRMSFVTTARGAGALARTFALLSGYRMPFVPHFEQVEEATFSAADVNAAQNKPKGKQQQKKRKK